MKISYKIFAVMFVVSGIQAKQAVDYDGNLKGKNGGVIITPQSVYCNGYLQSVTTPALAGYLQQSFGGQNQAPAGTNYITPRIIPGGVSDTGQAVVVQPDGKIVVGGYSRAAGENYYSVARFLPNGILDSSFGGNGTGVYYLPVHIGGIGASIDQACAIALQPDGKIVLAGYSNVFGGDVFFSVVRLLPNGLLDQTFAGTGYTIINQHIAGGNINQVQGIAIQPDGKIVLGGYSGTAPNYFIAAARLLPNGGLDTTFAGTGYMYVNPRVDPASTNDQGYGVALQPDGKIVIVGSTGTFCAIVRLLADGSLDQTFNGTGKAFIDDTIAPGATTAVLRAVALQPNGAIVGIGYGQAIQPDAFSIAARWLPNGALDTSFGGIGLGYRFIPRTYVAGVGEYAYAVALQADGKIIGSGLTVNNLGTRAYFSVFRLLSNGMLDTSFGWQPNATPGTAYVAVIAPNPAVQDTALGVAVLANGNIILAGETGAGLNTNYYALVQLTSQYTLSYYQDEYPTQGGFY